MKKILSVVLSTVILLSCFSIFGLYGYATDSDISNNLVVAYDFEGNTQTYQLSDKATAGTVDEILTVNGTVTVKDGVATVANDADSKLAYSKASADLKNLTEYTLYMKVKQSGTATAWSSFIDAGGLCRWYLKPGDTASRYIVNFGGTNKQEYNNVAIEYDTWMYVAMAVKLDVDSKKVTFDRYYSTDGKTYTATNASFTKDGTAALSANGLQFGTGEGLTFSYDDIMIFNKALSATEVEQISSLKLKTISNNMVAAYDFNGIYRDEQFADKAAAGSVKDDLTPNGTVTINNGVATVAAKSDSYLSLKGSADTANLSEYTVAMKVKFSGTYGANWANVFDGGKALKFIVNGDNSMQVRLNSEYGKRQDISDVAQDSWLYYVITVKLDGTKMYLNRYDSSDGVTYGSPVASSWDFTTKEVSFPNSLLGSCNDDDTIAISYDDIMIFDRALGAGEVAELSTIKISDDSIADSAIADAEKLDVVPTPSTSANLKLIGVQSAEVNDGDFDVRLVATIGVDIDTLTAYTAIGFDISAKHTKDGSLIEMSDKPVEFKTNYVYESINGNENGKQVSYTASMFEDAKFLSAISVKDVSADGKFTLTVTPCVYKDGQKEMGKYTYTIIYLNGALYDAYVSAVNN